MIVDDGGHTPAQQRASYERLFPALRHGGLYIIEDIETSFWRNEARTYDEKVQNGE